MNALEIVQSFFPEVEVEREVVSFDRKGGFAPGEYQLSKPTHLLGHHRGGKSGKANLGKPTVYRHFTEGIRAALGS